MGLILCKKMSDEFEKGSALFFLIDIQNLISKT
jgi:hypothetical protein